MPLQRFSKRWVAVALTTMVLLIWLVGRLIAWSDCSWYGYQTNRDTRYAAFVGCMVQVNGNWYPRNELRVAQ